MNHPTHIDVDGLRSIFANRCVVDDEKLLRSFSLDQVGDERYAQRPAAVVFPETTDEIVALVKWANRTGTPITPRGAGSGLAGGAIPVAGGVVCSFRNMDRIIEIDVDNLMVVVEPGVITNALDRALKPHGLFFAGYPMSEDICFVGGNVAENAGGGRAVKYGVTGNYVLGAKVVTGSGDVITLGGKRIKDVTGYNLLQLFIGSEGTLGLFTELTIRVIPRPAQRAIVLSTFSSSGDATGCVAALKRELPNGPSSIEYIDGTTAKETDVSLPKSQRTGIPESVNAVLLVELDGYTDQTLSDQLEAATGICERYNASILERGTDSNAMARSWKLRKQIPWWAKRHAGPWQTLEDVVVPPASIVELVAAVEELRDRFNVAIPLFGHAGDGNFHLVPLQPADMKLEEWDKTLHQLLDELYDRVAKLGGTISGEHGIGRKRVPYVRRFIGEYQLQALRGIKKVFDPKGILNPGVIIES